MPERPSLTKNEIAVVFACLNLETAKQREAVLALGQPGPLDEIPEPGPFTTFIGTETEPLAEREAEHAGMERAS